MRATSCLTLLVACLTAPGVTLSADDNPTLHNPTVAHLEKLDRGAVAVKTDGGVFLSWRRFDADAGKTYDLYRDGTKVNDGLSSNASNFLDPAGTATSQYTLKVLNNGTVEEEATFGTVWGSQCRELALDTPQGSGYNYWPNDMTVGDVDADGQLELILKWDPTNSKDNSQTGKTGNVVIDCLKLDGTKLWRIDLGQNIRAGAHYTQMSMYDFDGDGRAELIFKTAPGSKDATGAYVSAAGETTDITGADNSAAYANSDGHISGGPEWLTLFQGATGKALNTIFYRPNRGCDLNGGGAPTGSSKELWGDSKCNRQERYLCAVAHLDQQHNAAAIFVRGYYTRAYVWAVDVENGKLKTHWLHASESKDKYKVIDAAGTANEYTPGPTTSGEGSKTLYNNGNHNMSVADVDNDGFDEIIWGAAALDNDGRLLYATGFGHGDAIHVADLNPDRPGLEVFDVHEEKRSTSWDLHDARTGEVLLKGGAAGIDNGRGIAAQLSATARGAWMSSSDVRDQLSCLDGSVASSKHSSVNQRIYWDGSLQEEMLDGDRGTGDANMVEGREFAGVKIAHFNGSSFQTTNYKGNTCNNTKVNPCLIGDILGDWREEFIVWDGTPSARKLLIYTTILPSQYAVTTLLHDPHYRMALAWQNGAYNQPPHLGYYLPDKFLIHAKSGGSDRKVLINKPMESLVIELPAGSGTATVEGLPAGITSSQTGDEVTISGTPTVKGESNYTVTAGEQTLKGKIHVADPPASLTLQRGSNAQRLEVGKATIADIVYKTEHCSAAAATGLPDGVTGTFDEGSLTIAGSITATAASSWTYTVSATPAAGYAAPAALTGTLVTWVPGKLTSKLDASLSGEQALGGLKPVGLTATFDEEEGLTGVVFDGATTSAHLELDKGAALFPDKESFTFTLWVRSSMPASSTGAYLIHAGSLAQNTDTKTSGKWIGLEYKGGNISFSVDDNVNKSECKATGIDATLFNGVWHAITCVRDATAKKLYLYLDGQKQQEAVDKTGGCSSEEPLYVGNRTVTLDNPFVGTLAGLQIYQGAASPDEVAKWAQTRSNLAALQTGSVAYSAEQQQFYDLAGHPLTAPAHGLGLHVDTQGHAALRLRK